jgi:hypothetical protein
MTLGDSVVAAGRRFNSVDGFNAPYYNSKASRGKKRGGFLPGEHKAVEAENKRRKLLQPNKPEFKQIDFSKFKPAAGSMLTDEQLREVNKGIHNANGQIHKDWASGSGLHQGRRQHIPMLPPATRNVKNRSRKGTVRDVRPMDQHPELAKEIALTQGNSPLDPMNAEALEQIRPAAVNGTGIKHRRRVKSGGRTYTSLKNIFTGPEPV